MGKSSTRTLFFDIETAPIVGTAWDKWEANLIWIIEDWYMLGFAYKWADEKKTHVVALPDFPLYKKQPKNDIEVIKALHALFEEADITIAHNGDRFDTRKTNTRILKHGLKRPVPPATVDTLKVARKNFNMTSYKLDDLGEFLGVGRKIKTDKDLWEGCMAGDMKSWRKMKRYNIQDVDLLERVYLKLLPWIDNHPALNILDERPEACPNCSQNQVVATVKYKPTRTRAYQYHRCNNCGWVGRVYLKGGSRAKIL